MILLIDNNDSFTYNVREAVEREACGRVVEVIGSQDIDIKAVGRYSHIIFSPGPGIPDDFPIMAQILERYSSKIPILGICLGHQAICRYYGARIVRADEVCHGVEQEIICDPESQLFSGRVRMTVGRYHSWVATNIPDTLQITAQTDHGIVMAVENRALKIYGVQFHPESYITEEGGVVIQNFIRCNF